MRKSRRERKGNNTVYVVFSRDEQDKTGYETRIGSAEPVHPRYHLYNCYASACWRLLLFITFAAGVEFELAMAVIVAPPLVFSTGTAGGFRRLAGAGGADLR